MIVLRFGGNALEGRARDSLVEGNIEYENGLKGEPVQLPWSFTPILDMDGADDDTGR